MWRSWLRYGHAAVRLLRPMNALLIGVGAVLGGLLVAGPDALTGAPSTRLLLAALSAACIGGAGNALNDVFDLDIDRVNRPGRPLPSGVVTARVAWSLWTLLSLAGLALGVVLSVPHALLAGGAIALLYAYNAWLKRVVLVGNGVVALLTGLALVYGGWAVGSPQGALAGAVFAVLMTLAREVVKDIQDVEGDRIGAARTLPLQAGLTAAARFATALLVLVLVLIPIPFLWLGYSGLYLLTVLGAAALLLWAIWLLQAPSVQAARASSALKGAMVFGMAALALA